MYPKVSNETKPIDQHMTMQRWIIRLATAISNFLLEAIPGIEPKLILAGGIW